MDEKRQIRALDRTQPGRSLGRGRGATTNHDYRRDGMTTPSTAPDGPVIGRNMQLHRHRHRHRHRASIRFLDAVGAELPRGDAVRVMFGDRVIHKRPRSVPG